MERRERERTVGEKRRGKEVNETGEVKNRKDGERRNCAGV